MTFIYEFDPYPLDMYRMYEKWTFYIKAFESYRITTRQCVHLVLCGHCRSRNKDDCDAIRSAIPENPMLHANFTAVCYNRRCCRSNFYIAGIGTFDLLCSCDLGLDLDLMTFIYELDPYSVEIYRMCEKWTSCFRKLSSDRHTDRQTDRWDRHRHLLTTRFAGGQ